MKKRILTAGLVLASIGVGAAPVGAVNKSYSANWNYQAVPSGYAKVETDTDFVDNNAITNVYIATDDTNLQATVPLKIHLVASTRGGALTTPQSTAYQLRNYSFFPISITEMNIAENGNADDWVIYQAINDIDKLNRNDTDLTKKIAGNIGDLKLSFTSQNYDSGANALLSGSTSTYNFGTKKNKANEATEVFSNPITYTSGSNVGNSLTNKWTAPYATTYGSYGTLPIEIVGSSSQLKTISNKANVAFKITYTISPNVHMEEND